MLLAALLPLLPAALPAAPHPDSISRTLVVVEGSTARVEVRFQTRSALEVLPELDSDGDGELSADELEAGGDALGAYLTERWRLIETGVEPPVRLGIEVFEDAALLDPEEERDGGSYRWAVARLRISADAPLRRFTVDGRLFLEQNPFHRDFLELRWNDEEPVRVLFGTNATRFDFEPEGARRPGVLVLFFRLGVEHILSGYDHLAFLLALLVAAPRWRSLLGVVTAFTIAHSISLAATVLDPDGPLARIPGRIIELAIALSIAYVAFETLLRRRPKNTWPEAFGFGLLHGLGFASYLHDALRGESLIGTSLFGFNVGVEAGQLAVVAAFSVLFLVVARLVPALSPGSDDPESTGIVPRPVRRVVSAGVFAVSLWWFAQRAGWLP